LTTEHFLRLCLLGLILISLSGPLVACEDKDSTAEKVGEAIEETGEEVGEAVKDAGEAAEDAAQ
jgi:hypothetical protein